MASAHPTPGRPDVILRPATAHDVGTLAAIADAAFRTDSHTQLKAVFHGDSSFKDGMGEGLKSWLDSPKVDLIVAEISGKPVGWVGWARRGFAGDTDLPLTGPIEEPRAATAVDPANPKKIKDLKDLTNDSMQYWVCRLMPEGCRCRIVVSCVVHPDFQGKGVGSRLIRWGTDKADQEGSFCWVQSSMSAVAAYEKYGFREIGSLEADLNIYAEGIMPGERYEGITGDRESWGTYQWVYMKRDAGV
ncbi:acetyltransferase [Colletotrichum karsti]|uniref:Acetyltransferase n=1 Tax=Colletotrichum karsti TaxID=1095194 RepID=A0A9P6LG92_9PEZI|nr:acetyltransferase [Colletotrichum karsti]KAF9871365.1 acetyltransferase [Colletotrichum karsti]